MIIPLSRATEIHVARFAEQTLPRLPRGIGDFDCPFLRFCCLLLLLEKAAIGAWIQKSGHGDGGIDSLESLSAVLLDSTLRFLTLEPTNGC